MTSESVDNRVVRVVGNRVVRGVDNRVLRVVLILYLPATDRTGYGRKQRSVQSNLVLPK